MKHLFIMSAVSLALSWTLSCNTAQAQSGQSCWGQATAVFAQTGEMGKHASQEPTPRLGLKNLAAALHSQSVLPEPTLQALGAFVADQLGLSIDACL